MGYVGIYNGVIGDGTESVDQMSAPVKLVGVPTGPTRFIKSLGLEVPTFLEDSDKGLKYHVPLEYRGDFQPNQLANYKPSKTYRTDTIGRTLCYGKTKADEKCSRRAINRTPYCGMHGGALHPLDRIVKDIEKAANPEEAQSLSRYRQFQAGFITVDDLDDEEIANCAFRGANGTLFRPKNIPRELAAEFKRAIYQRAEQEMRSLDIEAVHTVGEIMKNRTNEPDIRLKAALSLIERNHGKAAQSLSITHDVKAFEEVFDSIQHVRSERPHELAIEPPIDAEIIGGEQPHIDSSVNETNPGIRDTAECNATESTDDEKSSLHSSNTGSSETSDSGVESSEQPSNARLFERNPAILAQELEIKPFNYDLGDHRNDISKATKKRYAVRSLGDNPNLPMVRHITKQPDGTLLIRHTEPVIPKVPKSKIQKDSNRKKFTLSDFG